MKKNLAEFTRDDFNTLFPVELVDHNPEWKHIFDREKQRILSAVDNQRLLSIEHFGSTSIPGIKAKPYIDMLIEIPGQLLFDENLIGQFKNLGYTHFKVPARDNIEAYMSFGKGYNLNGKKEQIFHIHMCPKENLMWEQIKFRDFLIENRDRTLLYEKLKIELAGKYKNDRGAYVLGKTEFIMETLKIMEEKANR